jgi:hypothetical protein
VSITKNGKKLMKNIFPKFNKQEIYLTSSLNSSTKKAMADALRSVTLKSQKVKSKDI